MQQMVQGNPIDPEAGIWIAIQAPIKPPKTNALNKGSRRTKTRFDFGENARSRGVGRSQWLLDPPLSSADYIATRSASLWTPKNRLCQIIDVPRFGH